MKPVLPAPGSTLPVALRPPTVAVPYQVTITWENYAHGNYQVSTIEKEVTLQVQSQEMGYALDFHSGPPRLKKSGDLAPLDRLALRLAALYEHVAVQASATGELVALLNHRALLKTWDRLAQEIEAETPEEDVLTINILVAISKQLFRPADFVQALQYDYLYQHALPLRYYQPAEAASPTLRQFANFFDKTPLWFAEQAAVAPGDNAAQLTLTLRGTLDAQKTDVAAVSRLIASELRQAVPPAGTPPLPHALPAPHFSYQATYTLAIATGLPLAMELSVYARVGEFYNKEYTLTSTRL
jgi:hypothetical protein